MASDGAWGETSTWFTPTIPSDGSQVVVEGTVSVLGDSTVGSLVVETGGAVVVGNGATLAARESPQDCVTGTPAPPVAVVGNGTHIHVTPDPEGDAPVTRYFVSFVSSSSPFTVVDDSWIPVTPPHGGQLGGSHDLDMTSLLRRFTTYTARVVTETRRGVSPTDTPGAPWMTPPGPPDWVVLDTDTPGRRFRGDAVAQTTPATLPSSPHQAVVSWTHANPGTHLGLDAYTVVATPQGHTGCLPSTTTNTTVPSTSQLALLDLDPGATYTIRVAARTAIGETLSPAATVVLPTTHPSGVSGVSSRAVDDRGISVGGNVTLACSGSGSLVTDFDVWARVGEDVFPVPGETSVLLDPGSTHDVFVAASLAGPPEDGAWERHGAATTHSQRLHPRAPVIVGTTTVPEIDGRVAVAIDVLPHPRDVPGRTVAWVVTSWNTSTQRELPAGTPPVWDATVVGGDETLGVAGKDASGVTGDISTVSVTFPSAIEPGAPREVVAVATSSVVTARWSPPLYLGGSESIAYNVTVSVDGAPVPTDVRPCLDDAVTCQVLILLERPHSTHDVSVSVTAWSDALVSPPAATVIDLLPIGAPDAPVVAQTSASGGRVVIHVTPPRETGGAPLTHACFSTPVDDVCLEWRYPMDVSVPCLTPPCSTEVRLRNAVGVTSASTSVSLEHATEMTTIVPPPPSVVSITGGAVVVECASPSTFVDPVHTSTDVVPDTGGTTGPLTFVFVLVVGDGTRYVRETSAVSTARVAFVGLQTGTHLASVTVDVSTSAGGHMGSAALDISELSTLASPTPPDTPTPRGLTAVRPSSGLNTWVVDVDMDALNVDVGGVPLETIPFDIVFTVSACAHTCVTPPDDALPTTFTFSTTYANLGPSVPLPFSNVNVTLGGAVGVVLGDPATPGAPRRGDTSPIEASRHAILLPDGWVEPPLVTDSGGDAVSHFQIEVLNAFVGGGGLDVGVVDASSRIIQLPYAGERRVTLLVNSVSRNGLVSPAPIAFSVFLPPACHPGTFDTAYTNISALVDPGSPCTQCGPGTWSGPDAAGCDPCPPGTIGPGECSPCPLGMVSLPGSVTCDPCPPGTFASSPGSTTCDPCPGAEAGIQFSLSGSSECSPCPAVAECPGGHLWIPDDVWVAPSAELTLFACPDPGRCVVTGGERLPGHVAILNTTHMSRLAASCTKQRWEGTLCKQCPGGDATGTRRHIATAGTCVPCMATWAAGLLTFGMVIVAVGVITFLIRRALASETATSNASPVVIVMICINHAQFLSVLSLLKIGGPTEFQLITNVADLFAGVSPDLLPARCLFGLKALDAFWLFMAMPIVAVAVATIAIVVTGRCRRSTQKHTQGAKRRAARGSSRGGHRPRSPMDDNVIVESDTKREARGTKRRDDVAVAITSSAVILLLMYVTLAKACLRMFDCYDVAIGGDHFLNADFNVVCGTTAHKNATVGAAVFGMAYLVIIPGAVMAHLYRRRDTLNTPEQRRYWGFVYVNYKLRALSTSGRRVRRGRYMWEAVVMAIKLSVMAVSAFIQNPAAQGITILWIITVAIALHAWFRPYVMSEANKLAIFSFAVLLATQLAALYVWTQEDTTAAGGVVKSSSKTNYSLIWMVSVNAMFGVVAVWLLLHHLRCRERRRGVKRQKIIGVVHWEADQEERRRRVSRWSTDNPMLERSKRK